MAADIRYARSGEVFVAYETIGDRDRDRDLLVVMEGFIPIDTMEEEPRLARSMRRLGSFARVIRFDRRGIGLSDPVAPSAPPTLEQWVEDALAVLDAVGSQECVLLACAEASPVGLLLAATHPERVSALVIVNGAARAIADVDYPQGLAREDVEAILDITDPSPGSPGIDHVAEFAPSAANDAHFREWWNETGRRGASPATARALLRVALESDVRSALGSIRAPTLIVHLRGDIGIEGGRYLADHLPDAAFVEIEGSDNYWWAADAAGLVLDEIEEFVTGTRSGVSTDRVLATVLFTDIVSSTEQVAKLGDQKWHELLDRHDMTVRRQLARFRGRAIKSTGDGFLATFDGPARAVECGRAIRAAARQLGLETRTGVHTGEVELRGHDIGGLAVHIAARVVGLAEPGQIWVSRTVTDLVVGSGLRFADRGDHHLKGVPDTWRLYAVED